MAGERILVVDDNPMNLKLVRWVLRRAGYEVREAASADAALAEIAEALPDAILMDLQLPGMDGLTLTRLLRSDPRTQRVPVIAVTAYAMAGDERRALDAGCDGYVTKPIDTQLLPRLVEQHLKQRRDDAR